MRQGVHIRERLEKVEAENARLKAELLALKPKPITDSRTAKVWLRDGLPYLSPDEMVADDNIELTFTDGKLTAAEVIG